MTERLNNLLNHLKPGVSSGLANALSKNADDVVITCALRTAMTKANKGAFKDTKLDYILLRLIEGIVAKSGIDPALVEDTCIGNVNEPGLASKIRAASLAAGLPNTASTQVVNRFCSSGLMAIQNIAQEISNGSIEVGIAIGGESMTTVGLAKDGVSFSEEVLANQESADCLQPMGWTSENVARDFEITREMQDRFAAVSYQRAEAAQKNGWFDEEILPITTKVKNPKTGEVTTITANKDEGPRHGTTFESLSTLKPVFTSMGGDRSTAGNSSQVTDGAAGILLMKRSTAQKLGQPILGKYVHSTVAGLAPRIMGIGPSVAIPKLLKQLNMTIDEVDVVELNEAFASMAVYCLNKLEIPHEKMNPRGGAIALGHPVGCTGARQIVTGLSELRRLNKKVLLTSMCIGSGMGMAALFINEA